MDEFDTGDERGGELKSSPSIYATVCTYNTAYRVMYGIYGPPAVISQIEKCVGGEGESCNNSLSASYSDYRVLHTYCFYDFHKR